MDAIEIVYKGKHGSIAKTSYMYYLLTPCCDASATGVEYGTACRGCYQGIDPFYGIAADAKDPDDVAKFMSHAKAFLG
jgi:hypothetical protein